MRTQLGTHHYGGWIRSLPGARAHLPVLHLPSVALPPTVDLSPYFPPAYDQGAAGSCTSQGWRGAYEALRAKEGEAYIPLSSLFIYYNERVIEGNPDQDAGAYIHDGSATLSQAGVCPESLWPYDLGKLYTKPPQEAYDAAVKSRLLQFSAVPNDEGSVKAALAAGLPIVLGFTVFENFESTETAHTGVMAMPTGSILGGHCVVVKGYGIPGHEDYYLMRNSWGPGWGFDGGNGGGDFLMPKAYLHDPNLCDELTVAQLVS
jgi:C1A family cysteine protease